MRDVALAQVNGLSRLISFSPSSRHCACKGPTTSSKRVGNAGHCELALSRTIRQNYCLSWDRPERLDLFSHVSTEKTEEKGKVEKPQKRINVLLHMDSALLPLKITCMGLKRT